jgi:hypothetical protein
MLMNLFSSVNSSHRKMFSLMKVKIDSLFKIHRIFLMKSVLSRTRDSLDYGLKLFFFPPADNKSDVTLCYERWNIFSSSLQWLQGQKFSSLSFLYTKSFRSFWTS